MIIHIKQWTIISLLILIFTAGCTTPSSRQVPYAYEELHPGMSLVLHKTIRFPAYTAAITIQTGELKQGLSLDTYYPNCRLELRSQSPQVQIIEPQRFMIYKIRNHIEYVMSKPVMLAGLGLHTADGTSDQVYSTILYLKSEKQPEVELLSCQHWEDPTSFPHHLTVDQIKQTLDDLFTLEN